MSWYSANEGSIRSKGTMYFVLHPHGLNMSGRWVGLGYDGRIMTGWAAMGQTQEEAEDTMHRLIASEGVPSGWRHRTDHPPGGCIPRPVSRSHLGTLVNEVMAFRARLAHQRGSSTPRASALTAAELRLLPLLSTHLSFPEIGKELFLSPHTIKSEMKSIYRKLGASSRNEAVTHARELGLLEG
jgi:DNA-binding CsgD family transcriptional regulator